MPIQLSALKTLFNPKALFKERPVKQVGDRLYLACVAQARQPVFYLDYGVEDAIGARFELLTFHVGLVIFTLKSVKAGDPRHAQAQETAQALFDAFLLALDTTLREQGTGDLAVPKKMKHLGQVIYTRMKHWEDLWTEGAGTAAEADYAARTIFAGSAYEGEDSEIQGQTMAKAAPAFAAYVDEACANLDVDALLRGQLDWCHIAALPDAV